MENSFDSNAQAILKRKQVYQKIWWRIIPLLFICYSVAFIDRINIGFTKLQMSEALGIDATWFGVAAGAFFLTYSLCEVPSNLLMAKWGARRTFFRIMMLWGLAAAATAFVTNVNQLITLRLLLGAFEAGFLPGIILYLTFWFPSSMRARVTAVVFVANGVAGSVASPLTGWILTGMDGVLGFAGWQWVFVVEGLPACGLGVLCFFLLRDRPDDARWLTAEEKAIVKSDLAREAVQDHSTGALKQVLSNPVNYLIGYLFFTAGCSNYLLFIWLPTIVQESGVASMVDVGLLSGLALMFCFIGAIAMSWSSDVLQERRWHLTLCFCLIAVGLMASTMTHSLSWRLMWFGAASFGTGASAPLILAIPPGYLSKKAAPVGIAFISTLANIGGFTSQPLLGYIKTTAGSLTIGVLGIAALGAVGVLCIAFAVPAKAMRVERGAQLVEPV